MLQRFVEPVVLDQLRRTLITIHTLDNITTISANLLHTA